jgi:predicted RNA binding protein YcfA (HicA-like mRNA interferase family)
LPRLKCTFGVFVAILKSYQFQEIRHGATSHRRYRGVVAGEVRLVDVAGHSMHDDIAPGTLNSMIRQSGLPKKLFRK